MQLQGSPSQHTVTAMGQTVIGVDEEDEKAIYFDGKVASVIKVNDHADFDFLGDFTIDCWVKWKGFQGNYQYVAGNYGTKEGGGMMTAGCSQETRRAEKSLTGAVLSKAMCPRKPPCSWIRGITLPLSGGRASSGSTWMGSRRMNGTCPLKWMLPRTCTSVG